MKRPVILNLFQDLMPGQEIPKRVRDDSGATTERHFFLMDLKEKIYQLIISRLDGDRICDHAYQEGILTLTRKGIGGFIIFGGKREELRPFIDKLQAIAEIPLFVASDIERGVGQQIEGYTNFPCQMAVRAAISVDVAEEMAMLREVIEAVALEAIDAGINMPLIPVLDVNNNPDNPIICTRAFSDNPEDVAFWGVEYIKSLQGLNLISCAKHFPGHGDTSTDSHISLPLIKKSYDELLNSDIRPFAEAVKSGVSSVMIGHLLIPSVDDTNPASLSKRVITDILRKGLGFDGLIMTDALNMSAISGIDNLAARCIHAGVDIILHPSDADLTVRGITDAVKTGVTTEETIDAAIERILKAKSRISQIKKEEVDFNRHSLLSRLITEKSVTLVSKKEGILPVAGTDKIQVVIAGEERLCNKLMWMEKYGNVYSLTKGEGDSVCHPEFISGSQMMQGQEIPKRVRDDSGDYRKAAFSGETVIIAIFSEVAAWRGNAGIDDKAIGQVIEIIKKACISIVISFGSPYILRHFNDADVLIAAYGANVQSQEAVIKCLKGETFSKGRLPVRL